MTITLYGIRNCDTVRKARSWLAAQGIDHSFHDYKSAGIDEARLRGWCAELGWKTLLNRAGTTFRKLPEEEKRDLDEDRAMALMLAQPSMIRRPVLDTGERRLAGFRPDVWRETLSDR